MSAAHFDAGRALVRGVLLVLALYFVATGLVRPLARPYVYSDFATFYSAAQSFAQGEDAYRLTTLRDSGGDDFSGWIGRYFYPPPFAACLLRPLAVLPFETARRIWVVIEAAAYLAAVALFASMVFGGLRGPGLVAAGLLAFSYAPVYLDFRLGSVSGLLFLLVVVFMRELARGRPNRAALALAAAIGLKLSPALVLAYLLVRGEWRFVGRTLLFMLALFVLFWPWTGVQPYVDYTMRVLPFLATANFSWFTNQSLDAFFWRLFVPNPDTTPWIASPILYRIATGGLGLVLLVGLAQLARRRSRTETSLVWEIACVLVASLLLARVTWEYMTVLALPCFLLWAYEAWRSGRAHRHVWPAVLAYALCALPFPYTETPFRSGIGLLLESPRTYGLCLLFVSSWIHLQRSRTPAPLATPLASGSSSVEEDKPATLSRSALTQSDDVDP